MTYTLISPNAPATATGSAYAVHYTVKGDAVEIMDHVKGGIGGRFSKGEARANYRQLLAWGYRKG